MTVVTVNVLTTKEREHLLKKCLVGLAEQSYTDFVVNLIGEEEPRIVEAIRKNLNVSYIKCKSKSISVYRHMASKRSRTAYIAFIDDDEVPCKDWLKTLVDTIERYEDKHMGAIGGPVITPLEVLLPSATLGSSAMSRSIYKLYYYIVYDSKPFEPGQMVYGMPTIGHFLGGKSTNIVNVNLLGTGNILLRKDALSKVSFDVNFVRAYEDYDLMLRLKMLGYRLLFNPQAWVVHLSRKKVADNSTISYLHGRDEARFVLKHLKMRSLPLHPRTFLNQVINLGYRVIKSFRYDRSEVYYVYGFSKRLALGLRN